MKYVKDINVLAMEQKKKNLRWKIHESKLNETECTAHNILSR